MSGHTLLHIDGNLIRVKAGSSVAAALRVAGSMGAARTSVTGQARAPFCGMGVCQECVVTVDRAPSRRACMEAVVDGMAVASQGLVTNTSPR